ncbi:YajG family lipoprotein [Lysobacter silvisoli]|uniref:Lipoprotein n=1 Tax=Lysobacter silvisoli TaxID=2293254 RepID=A0A371JX22_9GAMM|nr:YajG family lipoprotein [Lysobacter silvisoli]RDZ26147.1 hypothetical protein DX914_17905 [Lysobacter silvisoli]
MPQFKTTVVAIAAIALSGCAFQKQAIRLEPKLEAPQSTIGSGKLTMVNVADERPRSTLGTRGVAGIGEQLTVEGDLRKIIENSVTQGLQQQGFATDGPMENQLRVEIRNLDYVVNSGFWAGKLNIEFLLKGICIKGNARPYEQMYRGEYRKNVQVVQGAASNNLFVNDVVSQAINSLLKDEKLMRCLAE